MAWEHISFELPRPGEAYYIENKGGFQLVRSDKYLALYLALWYPALVFALASVGIMRLHRFTILSCLSP